MKRLLSILLAAAMLPAASCIENDIPYPAVELSVTDVSGEGFTVSNINETTRTVTLMLEEQTDMGRVHIDRITLGARSLVAIGIDDETLTGRITASQPLSGEFDLRTPLPITLSLYQDYEWTIRAEQTIERAFTVAGQIGATEIDAGNRTATAYVPKGTDLSRIEVTKLKLGPAGITDYSPTAEELSATGFETVRFVDASYRDTKERWMLYVLPTEVKIAVRETDLWFNTATVTALVTEEELPRAEIRYRQKGSETWLPAQRESTDGGILSCGIAPEWVDAVNDAGAPVKRLNPATGMHAGRTYELQLLIDGEPTETSEYTAPEGDLIPDGDMENPSLSCFTSSNSKAEFWASGNNNFAPSLCTQSTFAGMGGSHCAMLKATSPLVVGLAAGNLMSGIFYKADLTTGVVGFGQSYAWTARPTALKVKYHATIGIIDQALHDGAPIGEKNQDKARIFVAIVDWSARHEVSSGVKAPTGVWDPAAASSVDEGAIIAYGSIFIDESTPGDAMVEISLPLNFYDTQARPSGRYTLVISSSTSAYGDFMVGCTKNLLYLDDFEWVYGTDLPKE